MSNPTNPNKTRSHKGGNGVEIPDRYERLYQLRIIEDEGGIVRDDEPEDDSDCSPCGVLKKPKPKHPHHGAAVARAA